MTEAVLTKGEGLESRLIDLANSREFDGPDWFSSLQQEALKEFEGTGLPTKRDESWQFTDLKAIRNTEFALASPAGISSEEMDSLGFSDLGCARVVFVNGYFSESLSSSEFPEGMRVRTIAQALNEGSEALKDSYNSVVSSDHGGFCNLNAALVGDGAFIEVDKGVVVSDPVQVVFVTVPDQVPTVVSPRILVVVGDNSQATIVEAHLANGDGQYMSIAVTEILAGDNAFVDFYKLQQEAAGCFQVATAQSKQGRNSNVRTTTITLTGGTIRNETNAALDGEGSWAELDGLYLIGKNHHVDNFTRIDHLKPNCDSREVYKGILADKATGVFRGRIVVAKGAQKTDSKQTNKNLLLSNDAIINTKPQLEIYADDVKCTHGATIGQLDKDAIFYLRARGISESTARSMLVYAFAREVVGRIKVESLQQELDNYLFDWLPKGELVRDAF